VNLRYVQNIKENSVEENKYIYFYFPTTPKTNLIGLGLFFKTLNNIPFLQK